MKFKQLFYPIIITAVAAFFIYPVLAQEFPNFPGRLEAISTHFEIKNSQYLNITVDSSEEIKATIESVPEMITMMIDGSTSSPQEAQIAISGFPKNTTFYKYQDNYNNETRFITDQNGSFSYIQDISQPHFVFIQPRAGTKFIKDDPIGGDCYLIGNWDNQTKTCALTTDVYESIQIDNDNLTLDGNNHSIIGSNTGFGIYLDKKNNLTFRNLNIKNFTEGIQTFYLRNSVLSNNIIFNNWLGIRLDGPDNNILTNNALRDNTYNFRLDGLVGTAFGNRIDTTNTVDGKPIYYLENAKNQTYDESTNAGLFFCVNCDNIIVKNLNLSKNYNGITFWNTNNSKIENITALNNYAGIVVVFSNNNLIVNNNLSNNIQGIILSSSGNNRVYNNNFLNNIVQSYVYGVGSGNVFNISMPQGGNYWDNYDTSNKDCQDQNNDNICDLPYYFYGGQDNLPWKIKDGWKAPPQEFWAEIQNTPQGVWRLRQEAGLDKPILKTLPNGWAVHVLNTTTTLIDSYYWYKVQDATDGSTGFMAGKNANGAEYLSYNSNDAEREKYRQTASTSTALEATDSGARRNEIISAVENKFCTSTNSNYNVFANDVWKKLIMGMAEQESGVITPDNSKLFNNEFVSYDYGHGIMQVTFSPSAGWDNRGKGGGVTIPLCAVGNNEYYKCYQYAGDNNHIYDPKPYKNYNDNSANPIYKQYSNTPQSIWANINDGFYDLKTKLGRVGPTSDTPVDIIINGATTTVSISADDMKKISAVYRYNQGSPNKVQGIYKIWYDLKYNKYPGDTYIQKEYGFSTTTINIVKDNCPATIDFISCLENEDVKKITGGDPLYLKHVGSKIQNSQFGSNYTSFTLGQELAAINATGTILVLRSPGELRLIDSVGRITGLVNGIIKEEVPNAFYDDENKAVIALSISDDYKYQVAGTASGTYGFAAYTIGDNSFTDFDAADILISTSTIHQYSIDWQKFQNNQDGVLLQIDQNNDGIFEKNIIAGRELAQENIVLQTETIININPDTLNLKSKGNDITAYIELPNGFNVKDINISTILLNNSVPALPKPTSIGDYNNNGLSDLMAKFDRQAVESILRPNNKAEITITGKLKDQRLFKSTDVIKVIDNSKTASALPISVSAIVLASLACYLTYKKKVSNKGRAVFFVIFAIVSAFTFVIIGYQWWKADNEFNYINQRISRPLVHQWKTYQGNSYDNLWQYEIKYPPNSILQTGSDIIGFYIKIVNSTTSQQEISADTELANTSVWPIYIERRFGYKISFPKGAKLYPVPRASIPRIQLEDIIFSSDELAANPNMKKLKKEFNFDISIGVAPKGNFRSPQEWYREEGQGHMSPCTLLAKEMTINNYPVYYHECELYCQKQECRREDNEKIKNYFYKQFMFGGNNNIYVLSFNGAYPGFLSSNDLLVPYVKKYFAITDEMVNSFRILDK